MALTKEFKNQAYDFALIAFFRVCKREHIYFQVLEEMRKQIGLEALKGSTIVTRAFDCFSNNIFWKELKKMMVPKIEELFMHARHDNDNDNYDYLVHSVNAFIRQFIEQGVCKTLRKPMKFDIIGEQMFTLAAHKIFGNDFQIRKPQTPPQPQSREEHLYVMKAINDMVNGGMDVNEAIARAQAMLEEWRSDSSLPITKDTYSSINNAVANTQNNEYVYDVENDYYDDEDDDVENDDDDDDFWMYEYDDDIEWD